MARAASRDVVFLGSRRGGGLATCAAASWCREECQRVVAGRACRACPGGIVLGSAAQLGARRSIEEVGSTDCVVVAASNPAAAGLEASASSGVSALTAGELERQAGRGRAGIRYRAGALFPLIHRHGANDECRGLPASSVVRRPINPEVDDCGLRRSNCWTA